MKAKNIIRIFAVTGLILLVPLVAMLFTDEVKWNATDFIIVGVLLICGGLMRELVRSTVDPKRRIVITGIFVIAILLIWVELAVGIFGTPISGS